MSSQENKIRELLRQQAEGPLTAEQRQELYEIVTADPKLADEIALDIDLDSFLPPPMLNDERRSEILDIIFSTDPPVDGERQPTIPISKNLTADRSRFPTWYWAAASIFLVLGIGSFFVLRQTDSKTAAVAVDKEMSSALADPKRVTLTVDGQDTVNLSTGNSGMYMEGAAAYSGGKKIAIAKKSLLLATPYGQQYQVRLPDGSEVWLNTASSIQFPSVFDEKERVVRIQGQAYFEVARDAAKPFRVISKGQEILVLGTKFDVNAYSDNPATITTLLAGSVRLHTSKSEALLKPAQQAVVSNGAEQIRVRAANIEIATAWRNGFFQYDHDDLHTVLRDLAKWYDLEIVFNDPSQDFEFSGKIYRDVPLAQALEILEFAGAKLRLEGKTVTVMSRNRQ